MTDELDPTGRRVSDALAAASAYAGAQPWTLEASHVMAAAPRPRAVRFGVGTPRRHAPRLAISAGAIAASVVLVLTIAFAAGTNRHAVVTPGSRPNAVPGRDNLIVGDARGLQVVSAVSGRVLSKVQLRWSGSLLGGPTALAVVPKSPVGFGVWDIGHGGPVLFGFRLSGGAPVVITDAPGGTLGPIALSPTGEELAYLDTGGLTIGRVEADGRLAHVGSLGLGQAFSVTLAWSPDGSKLLVVESTPRASTLDLLDPVTMHLSRLTLRAAAARALPASVSAAAWSGDDIYLDGRGRTACRLVAVTAATGRLVSSQQEAECAHTLSVDAPNSRIAEALTPFEPNAYRGPPPPYTVRILGDTAFLRRGLGHTIVQWVSTRPAP